MSTPTKEEKDWMSKVQKLLTNPPSERLGLYTIGDNGLSVYDKSQDAKIDQMMYVRNIDYCQAVHELDAFLGSIDSATNIHSTAG